MGLPLPVPQPMSAGGGGRGLPGPAPLRRPLLWLLLLLGAGGWGAAGSLPDHYQALGVPPAQAPPVDGVPAAMLAAVEGFRTICLQATPQTCLRGDKNG